MASMPSDQDPASLESRGGDLPSPRPPALSDQYLTSQQVKHLEFIQGVVARLGNNSFLVKGWALTVAGGLLAFAASTQNTAVAATTLIPLLAFWYLDGYLLRQERLFRALYDDARRVGTTVELFSMNVGPYAVRHPRFGAMFSVTLNIFYGAMTAANLAVLISAVTR